MKIAEVVNQIRAVLPGYTNYFHDQVNIASIAASAGSALVTTTTAHGLKTGQLVNMSGVGVKTPIDSFTVSGTNYTFTTTTDHDITFGWPEHANITLGGFTNSAWNGSKVLKSSNNRRQFVIQQAGAAPSLNGNEYLLEVRVDGINGSYLVTVNSPTTFTITGSFVNGAYLPLNGKVASNVRVASTVDIERALEQYTKNIETRFWMFVEPVDADVSKDRTSFSDAIATRANGDDMRMRIIDGFTVYIVAPTDEQMAAETALDICRHDLLLPMCRTLYGTKFSTGLTTAAEFKTILARHSVTAYNRAFLVYSYEFEVVMDLTDTDQVLPSATRAFRDIENVIGVGNSEITSDINLDLVEFE